MVFCNRLIQLSLFFTLVCFCCEGSASSSTSNSSVEIQKDAQAFLAFHEGDLEKASEILDEILETLSPEQEKSGEIQHLKGLIKWQYLLKSMPIKGQELTLRDYIDFQKDYPKFPYRFVFQDAAEKTLTSETPKEDVLLWFQNRDPRSPQGLLALLPHLDSKKRKAALIEKAYEDMVLTSKQEKELLKHARQAKIVLNPEDRFFGLLAKTPGEALGFLKAHKKDFSKERFLFLSVFHDFKMKKPALENELKKLTAEQKKDPAFVEAYFIYLVQTMNKQAVPFLMDHQKILSPRKEELWRPVHILGRDLLISKQYQEAVAVLSLFSYEGDQACVEQNFLKGLIELQFLNQPKAALISFKTALFKATLSRTKSKLYYWCALARQKLGEEKRYQGNLQVASFYQKTYYGQLALDKLGKPLVVSLKSFRSQNGRFQNAIVRDMLAYADVLKKARRFDLIPAFLYRAFYNLPSSGSLKSQQRQIFLSRIQKDFPEFFPNLLQLAGMINRYREGYQIHPQSLKQRDPALINAVIRKETNFNAYAISHAGARGIMQTMVDTAEKVLKAHPDIVTTYFKGNFPDQELLKQRLLDDVALNVRVGSRYIEDKLALYEGHLPLLLVAYNAGPLYADRWIERYGDPRGGVDLETFIELIPFYETRSYVKRVLASRRVYQRILAGK